MFSYNSFSASARSKHSPALCTQPSNARLGLRFQQFHHGLERHSYSSTAHLSSPHLGQYQRSTYHHGHATVAHDITPVVRETAWLFVWYSCSRIWPEDRLSDVVVANVYFRQRLASAVQWWMDIDQCIDLIRRDARVATSQADRRHKWFGCPLDRPISGFQWWSFSWCRVCTHPQLWSISHRFQQGNTTRKSFSSSIHCQYHIRQKHRKEQHVVCCVWKSCCKFLFLQIFVTHIFQSSVTQMTSFVSF